MNNFVDIWVGDILCEEIDGRNYWALLNDSEKIKAKQFLRPQLQQKYIRNRAMLKQILSSYLNTEPQQLKINTHQHGKPFLENNALTFNLSHSKNKFVVAVSNCSELGVDVEENRKRHHLAGLVDKCFSDRERLFWHGLAESQKIAMFYRFWVRKEAFVKAVGRGIALGLDQCEVNTGDDLRSFVTIPECYGKASDWKILDIPVDESCFCALVTQAIKFKYKQIALK